MFLLLLQYTQNKSFCEDLTEGKFSFPIIHGILSQPSSTKLLSILTHYYVILLCYATTQCVDEGSEYTSF